MLNPELFTSLIVISFGRAPIENDAFSLKDSSVEACLSITPHPESVAIEAISIFRNDRLIGGLCPLGWFFINVFLAFCDLSSCILIVAILRLPL